MENYGVNVTDLAILRVGPRIEISAMTITLIAKLVTISMVRFSQHSSIQKRCTRSQRENRLMRSHIRSLYMVSSSMLLSLPNGNVSYCSFEF